MRYVLLFTFLLFPFSLSCNDNKANIDHALVYTQKAIYKLPQTQQAVKQLEKYVIRKTKLKKKTVFVITTVAASLYKGEIGTKPIRKISFRFLGGHVRPDFVYSFKKQETVISAVIKWEF